MYELVRHINAAAITHFHDAALCPPTSRHERHSAFQPVWQKIEENHRCNALLWIEEDKGRSIELSDGYIAASKRRIDRYNEQRLNAMQEIDERLLEVVGQQPRHSSARLHSETAGAMIDRLSILALRIHHARTHADRARAAQDGASERARTQLVSLVEQRVDLARCFDELIAGAALGLVYFKIYVSPARDGARRPAAPPVLSRNA